MGVTTILGHLDPYIVVVEGIPVRIEASQSRLVHGSILLVPEHDPVARLAFSRSLSTLTADRLDFIALELSLAACLAVAGGQVSMFLSWDTRPAFPEG